MIPKLYDELKAFLITKFKPHISKPSFIIDLWASGNNEAYLSFTAHFIHSSLLTQRINVVLETLPYSGDHSADNIAIHFLEAMTRWDIDSKDYFYVVHDDGRNIVAAMRNLNFSSIRCTNHKL